MIPTMNRPPLTNQHNNLYSELFRRWERSLLQECLIRHSNNQCAVARELGLHRNTVRRMVCEHNLYRRRLQR